MDATRPLNWATAARLLEPMLVGAACGLFALSALYVLDAEAYQAREADHLALALSGTSSVASDSRDGSRARALALGNRAWAKIELPRVGLSALVAEGTEGRTLRRAVGHVAGTAFPGEPGMVVLAGHRDGFFGPLRTVEKNDRIRMTTPDGVFTYQVTGTEVVDPDRTDVLTPRDGRRLALVTCHPFGSIGPSPNRLVVYAVQESPPDH